ncbi:MAG: hypothetical protein U1E10_17975 [Bdellovibrionales bacterium]|jgi:hypothetical protein|nr:hypothetical protein [Bdellovibrionales bacterium]
MSLAIQRFTLATLLIAATAFWTPWWGTILVALAMAFLSGFSTALLATASFFGWIAALSLRDLLNEQGPSRTLVRMLSLGDLGNSIAQPLVIIVVALIGACLGGSTAGLINTIKKWRQLT